MQIEVNHEQVGVRLANQLATALYQKAVLETMVEQLQQPTNPTPTQTTEGNRDERL